MLLSCSSAIIDDTMSNQTTTDRAEWRIEDQSLEYQVAYWQRRAEIMETKLDREQNRKTPPERTELEELRKELEYARSGREAWMRHTETWKRVAQRFADENDELKKGTRIPRLEAELEQWKYLWRNCTKRLGNCIEHLGFDHTGTEPNMEAE